MMTEYKEYLSGSERAYMEAYIKNEDEDEGKDAREKYQLANPKPAVRATCGCKSEDGNGAIRRVCPCKCTVGTHQPMDFVVGWKFGNDKACLKCGAGQYQDETGQGACKEYVSWEVNLEILAWSFSPLSSILTLYALSFLLSTSVLSPTSNDHQLRRCQV
jgi:hypothetical protein